MKADEFVSHVRQEAHLSGTDDVLKATRATLMTLGERLKGREPVHLASQLPPEIGQYLCASDAMGGGERMSLEAFMQRISEREGVDLDVACDHAGAIFKVICEAVDAGEISDVRAQLPPDYQGLFRSHTTH